MEDLQQSNQEQQQSQRQRLTELLIKMGVKFEVEDNALVIDNGKGYHGFYCEIEFDENGKMTSYGCWE